jgi:O-antigen ligase
MGVSMIVAQTFRQRKVVRALSLIALFACATLIAAEIATGHNATIAERTSAMMTGQSTTVVMRLALWRAAARGIWASPLLGKGLEITNLGRYPHDSVLEAFYATGLLGGVLYLVIVLWSLRGAVKMAHRRTSLGWVGAIFAATFTLSLVSGALYSDTELWLLVGLCLALERAGTTGQHLPGSHVLKAHIQVKEVRDPMGLT